MRKPGQLLRWHCVHQSPSVTSTCLTPTSCLSAAFLRCCHCRASVHVSSAVDEDSLPTFCLQRPPCAVPRAVRTHCAAATQRLPRLAPQTRCIWRPGTQAVPLRSEGIKIQWPTPAWVLIAPASQVRHAHCSVRRWTSFSAAHAVEAVRLARARECKLVADSASKPFQYQVPVVQHGDAAGARLSASPALQLLCPTLRRRWSSRRRQPRTT